MGLEPTTLGTTNRCSDQLSYSHRIIPLSGPQIYCEFEIKSKHISRNFYQS